ncbi:hypothetical protein CAEBREN_26081 [Caenorhabditis brenneri]|uniref:Uncharacterized protein n=1 Tax=Caenorhabditis brenneri TaxID=135651 RepID=G0MY73_CAEBE|nr:hypothetical protein CAEBREN_26081 [Caenorhabditis brenneri]
MNTSTTPISSPPSSDSAIFNPNQPMISRKISDPTGVTMEWSRKIDLNGGEKIRSGFYTSKTENGETVIRSVARMTFHSNENAYEFGDDTSMLNFIRQQMQLELPDKMDTNCSAISPQGQDPSSGTSVILATSSVLAQPHERPVSQCEEAYEEKNSTTSLHSISHEEFIEMLKDNRKRT